MQITLDLPDELVSRLSPLEDKLPQILELGLRELNASSQIGFAGATDADNLALSCVLCNKHKGSDLASIDPETGEIIPLYHPRRDTWHEHF